MTTSANGDWRNLALCHCEDPELFFPVGSGPVALAQTEQAKAVCARCPVVSECLEFALRWLPEGVAGGLASEERSVLRTASRVAVVGERSREWVGASLMSGDLVRDASCVEVARAAVELYLAGHRPSRIATLLQVNDRQIYRWLERNRSGRPLVPNADRGRVSRGIREVS